MNQYQSRLIAAALNVMEKSLREPGQAFGSPAVVRDFLRLKLGALEHEVFALLYLNAQNQLIAYEELFRGTANQTAVYPREVARRALFHNALAVILAHNHPSGTVDPSRADRLLTDTLRDALALIEVRVLDHVIVGSRGTYSFAEHGLL